MFEVENQERRGAEIDYLKRYGKEWLKISASTDASQLVNFLKTHPRFAALVESKSFACAAHLFSFERSWCSVHGAPEESELRKNGHIVTGVLKHALLKLTLIGPEQQLERRVPCKYSKVTIETFDSVQV